MDYTGKEKLQDIFLMTLGTLLVSVGVYFFKFPNHFSMGGVSGLADGGSKRSHTAEGNSGPAEKI